jgi:hypothetical protein
MSFAVMYPRASVKEGIEEGRKERRKKEIK